MRFPVVDGRRVYPVRNVPRSMRRVSNPTETNWPRTRGLQLLRHAAILVAWLTTLVALAVVTRGGGIERLVAMYALGAGITALTLELLRVREALQHTGQKSSLTVAIVAWPLVLLVALVSVAVDAE